MTKSAIETEQQAAEWLTRRESGHWSSSDQAALDTWASRATANRIALLRLETVWQKADRLRAVRPSAMANNDDDYPGSASRSVRWFRSRYVWPVAAAFLAVVAVPAYYQTRSETTVYATDVGGFQRLPLADGSRVDLNTSSRLDVRYSTAERRVRLEQGEAYFKVAHDRGRPFVVEAGDYRVIAVGTAFTVRLKGRQVDVTVTEGRVRIEGPPVQVGNRPAYISAGQAANVATATPVVRQAGSKDIEAALGWRDGLLTFENRPLSEVVEEFNRYNKLQMIVDPSAANVVIDGSFRATNGEGFVRLLGQGFDVKGVPANESEIVLKRR